MFCWDDGWALETGDNQINHPTLIREHVHDACDLAGVPTRFCLAPEQVQGLQTIIVAAKIIEDPAWETALADAVANGAHLICLPLLFAKDTWNAWRTDYQSDTMRTLQGARLVRRIPIRPDHHISGNDNETISFFAEEWASDSATPGTRTFADGPLAGQAMSLTADHGTGRVTTIAGFVDAKTLASFVTT